MAPKAKKPSGGQKPEDEQDDPLQAVVFTDSYETRFAPFTLETPRVCIMEVLLVLGANCGQCLLPLVNVPLIEYTLEFLANAGVEEVYVLCGSHKEQIEEYLR
jgi:translation initiation factor eIF-2B subunit epsilon